MSIFLETGSAFFFFIVVVVLLWCMCNANLSTMKPVLGFLASSALRSGRTLPGALSKAFPVLASSTVAHHLSSSPSRTALFYVPIRSFSEQTHPKEEEEIIREPPPSAEGQYYQHREKKSKAKENGPERSNTTNPSMKRLLILALLALPFGYMVVGMVPSSPPNFEFLIVWVVYVAKL